MIKGEKIAKGLQFVYRQVLVSANKLSEDCTFRSALNDKRHR
jgi:hypothetical protein